MKKALLALFPILLLVVPSAKAAAPTQIQFSWTYAYTGTYAAPCSTTVTTNCISSFRINEGSTVIATIPATAATSYNYSLTPLPAAGNHTYTLVATGVYTGGSIDSAPATVSLQVPTQPSVPQSFTGVLQ